MSLTKWSARHSARSVPKTRIRVLNPSQIRINCGVTYADLFVR